MKSSRPFRPLAVLIAVTAALAVVQHQARNLLMGRTRLWLSADRRLRSESQNLLVDTRFQNLGQGSWAYVQPRPQSFSFTSEQGELELRHRR